MQLILFLKDQNSIPKELLKYIFTFWGGNQKVEDIENRYKRNKRAFDEADMVLIETCSIKDITFNANYNLQMSRYFDSEKWGIPKPPDSFQALVQIDEISQHEFETQLGQLLLLIGKKKVILTGHINSDKFGADIISRKRLNAWLKKISTEKQIPFYDVSGVVKRYPKLLIDDESIHFSKLGKIVALWLFIKKLMSK